MHHNIPVEVNFPFCDYPHWRTYNMHSLAAPMSHMFGPKNYWVITSSRVGNLSKALCKHASTTPKTIWNSSSSLLRAYGLGETTKYLKKSSPTRWTPPLMPSQCVLTIKRCKHRHQPHKLDSYGGSHQKKSGGNSTLMGPFLHN